MPGKLRAQKWAGDVSNNRFSHPMRAFISHRLLVPVAALALAAGVQAGQEIAQPKSKILIPEDPPLGSLTLGGQFSEGV